MSTPERAGLEKFVGKRTLFKGKYITYDKKTQMALFRPVRDKDGNLVSDHLWVYAPRKYFKKRCNYSFQANVGRYVRKNNTVEYGARFADSFKLIVDII